MKTATLVFGLVISLAAVSFAQVRTVTNSSLQKFQEKRLAAERDYRENYARMGFPSPEELDRQREADMAARIQLSEKLRQVRLENERLELERQNLELQSLRLNQEMNAYANSGNDGGYYDNGYYGGYYGGYGYGGYGFNYGRGFRGQGPRPPLGGIGQGNRLLPMVDRRGAYRVTPFEVIPVPNPRPVFRGGGVRGGGRRR